jgi:hypothetical protein
MKRPLSIIFSGVVFATVIVAALALSMQKLMQWKNAGSTAAAPPQEVVSANSKNSPTIVGTDHPVPVDPPRQLASRPKPKAPNPPATPVPQASALVENDSRHQGEAPSDNASRHQAVSQSDNASRSEAESPVELVREKAEQAREKAERLRARVEALYQSRRISEAEYKQAQAEYQHELAEYENRIAKLRSTTTGTGAANE